MLQQHRSTHRQQDSKNARNDAQPQIPAGKVCEGSLQAGLHTRTRVAARSSNLSRIAANEERYKQSAKSPLDCAIEVWIASLSRTVAAPLLQEVSGRVVEYQSIADQCLHVLLFSRRSSTRNPEMFVDRKLCFAGDQQSELLQPRLD